MSFLIFSVVGGHAQATAMFVHECIRIMNRFQQNYKNTLKLVMGGIENFLSRLLKGKIPRYHGILPYSDFSIFY